MTDERRFIVGNASLSVTITNGNELVVEAIEVTTEQAVAAVCAYLPVVPVPVSSVVPITRLRGEVEESLRLAEFDPPEYEHGYRHALEAVLRSLDGMETTT